NARYGRHGWNGRYGRHDVSAFSRDGKSLLGFYQNLARKLCALRAFYCLKEKTIMYQLLSSGT
ncbi:MAG: hypothetical protein ACW7DQ_20180, partial [Paraglaciecola chathamensis]